LCGVNSFAQNFNVKFKHISIESGLSEVNARCILQDRYGFLWIGTQDGLNRFDGNEFVIFRNDPEDSNSITGNFINCLLEDKDGILWIGTLSGLTSYNPVTGKFNQYSHAQNITALCEDVKGRLWIGTNNKGILIFDKRKNQFSSFLYDTTDPKSLSTNSITAIYKDKSGIIWIGTDGGGLNKFINQSDSSNKPLAVKNWFEHYVHNPEKNSICSNGINSLCEDYSGNIIIGTNRGLSIFWKKKKRFQNFTFDYSTNTLNKNGVSTGRLNNILTVYCDKSNQIWIGTMQEGLIWFDLKKRIFTRYRKEENNPVSINNNNIYSIYEDKNEILWIGTGKGGLNKFDKKRENFYSISKLSNQISDNSVGAILEDSKGYLWLGTDNGLNKIELSTGKISKFFHDPFNSNSLSNNKVTALAEDKSGNIWIGTRSGLNKFVPAKNIFTRYFTVQKEENTNNFLLNSIGCLHVDKHGILWLGISKGLARYNPVKNKFDLYKPYGNFNHLSRDNMVSQIYQDSSETIWLCTVSALNKFEPTIEKFTSYFISNKKVTPKSVFGLYENPNHIFWLGTDAGLIKFDPKTKAFKSFTVNDGLANNIVYTILPDNFGNLWMSSLQGISKFNPVNETFTNYNPTIDGFASNEYNVRSHFKSKSGRMYFGGVNGLIYFHPDSIKENSRIPQIAVTSLKIFDDELFRNRIYASGEKILLNYFQNFLSFEFSSLDFTDPAKNQFAYFLDGVDSSWIYSGNRHYTSYTQLMPGKYIFRIKASNNDGVWNNDGISIAIIITPPFWQTWWFRIMVIISLISLLVYVLWNTHIKKLKKKIEKLQLQQELQSERMRISQDMHDELGASLTKINLVSSRVINENAVDNHVKEHVLKIHEFSNEVIKKLDEIVWTVNPGNDNLKMLISYLCENIEEFLSLTSIAVRFDIPANIPAIVLSSEIRHNIFLVVKEALNNLVKYSEAQKVILRIKVINNSLAIEIVDNGKGFEIEQVCGNGNGLINMKDRIEKVGGRFWIHTSTGCGTKIGIELNF